MQFHCCILLGDFNCRRHIAYPSFHPNILCNLLCTWWYDSDEAPTMPERWLDVADAAAVPVVEDDDAEQGQACNTAKLTMSYYIYQFSTQPIFFLFYSILMWRTRSQKIIRYLGRKATFCLRIGSFQRSKVKTNVGCQSAPGGGGGGLKKCPSLNPTHGPSILNNG